MMRICICERVRRDAEALKEHLVQVNSVFDSAETRTLEEERELDHLQKTDYLILDESGNDIEILETVRKYARTTNVIFLTEDFKQIGQAFDAGAFDCLLKPLTEVDIDNIAEVITYQKGDHGETDRESISGGPVCIENNILGISGFDTIEFIQVNKIRYLKASGKYTEIHLKGRHIISSKNLKIFENILDNDQFVRVHNSYIINLREIRQFVKDELFVVLRDKTEIPISRSRKTELLEKLIYI